MTTDDLNVTEATSPRRRPAPWRRISPLEVVLAGLAVVVLAALVLAEPDILQAPFENGRTLLFTFGGTALAAVAFAVLLAIGVPAPIRVLLLGVPFVVVSWWLISPFFLDEEVEDRFETSIAAARREPTEGEPTATTLPAPSTATSTATSPASPTTAASPAPPAPARPGPVLLGAGRFVGLAGHDGTGEAGIFRTGEGAHVLRLENLDIDNGPDLRLYVVPGADQVSPGDMALYVGPLRGNVGNLTYDLPPGFRPAAGPWTVLVWCEAFGVEFVGATLAIA